MPPKSQQPEEQGIYYLGRVGQRTQMTRATESPYPPPALPPPMQLAGPRPQLPPLSNIASTTRPSTLSPQWPPPSSSGLSSAPFKALPPSALPMAPNPTARSKPSFPSPLPNSATSPSHPPLYPQRASFQSKNPGTVYEALSPVEHQFGGPSSMFGESSHGQSGLPSGPGPSFQGTGVSSPSSMSSPNGPNPLDGQARLYQHPGANQSPGINPLNMRNPLQNRCVLTMRQQPLAARACGFGERDRRVIDPPPVVQFSLKDFNPASKADLQELQSPTLMISCSLLAVDPPASSQQNPNSASQARTTDVTMLQDPHHSERISRRLMGTIVSSPFVGEDPELPESLGHHARLSTFFIFSDLSCRQNGRYRLRFICSKLPPEVQGSCVGALGTIDSEDFQVYSAKDFPGMTPSSPLIRDLRRQGAPVSVRKGNPARAGGGKASSGKEKMKTSRRSSISASVDGAEDDSVDDEKDEDMDENGNDDIADVDGACKRQKRKRGAL